MLSAADVIGIQDEVTRVRVDDSLVNYALAIVNRTRESAYLSLGVSPRGGIMLYRAAQGMAFLDSRDFATPDDFKPLAVPVFAPPRRGQRALLVYVEKIAAGGRDPARDRGRRPCAGIAVQVSCEE